MTVLTIKFADFKRLAGNKRVYYYKGDGFYDFQFLEDSILVKSTVNDADIDNKKQFFSDSLFYGATELVFQIPVLKTNVISEIENIKTGVLPSIIDVVEAVQSVETKSDDIQREGVNDSD